MAAQGISKSATLSLLPSRIITGGVEGSPKEQETHHDSTVGGESSSTKAFQISSAQATLHGPPSTQPIFS